MKCINLKPNSAMVWEEQRKDRYGICEFLLIFRRLPDDTSKTVNTVSFIRKVTR